jgi:hypothetical protein
MFDSIINFISNNALGKVQVMGMSGLVFLVFNWVLSKYKIPERFTRWLDSTEARMESSLDKFISSAGLVAFNWGVGFTVWINQTPVVNWIYEKLLEPILIITVEGVLRLLSVLLDKLSTLIVKMTNKFVVGLRSDNKNVVVKEPEV